MRDHLNFGKQEVSKHDFLYAVAVKTVVNGSDVDTVLANLCCLTEGIARQDDLWGVNGMNNHAYISALRVCHIHGIAGLVQASPPHLQVPLLLLIIQGGAHQQG